MCWGHLKPRSVSTTSFTPAGRPRFKKTCAVWPSMTGTRFTAEATGKLVPRILLSSGPIFSSSPGIQGMTLATESGLESPSLTRSRESL